MTAEGGTGSVVTATIRQPSQQELSSRISDAHGARLIPALAAPVPRQANLLFWKNVLLAHVHSRQPNLTNRQMAVLMVVYASSDPQTVGSLASRLKLSGPVVGRSINMLEALGYLKRARDLADGRSTLMMRTALGVAFLDVFDAAITRANASNTKGTM